MPQIFHRSTNTISRFTIFGTLFVVAAVFWAIAQVERSPYTTYAGVVRPQLVSLADLFASALSDSPQFADRSLRFAHGLSALVGARAVLIRCAPVAPSDDSESIYFTVSADETRPMILQVFFDPDRPPSPIEFALLKAAAPTAAALLELGRLSAPRLLTAGVA